MKCPSLNNSCNTRSSLKRNLQRTLTRRGSSEKEMSRNRLEKVDKIRLKRNILFICNINLITQLVHMKPEMPKLGK